MASPVTDNNLQVEVSNRQIFRIALPISLAIFIPQLNFIINNIFLGHYQADSHALAVAGITGVYYLIFSAIGFGLNNGLQALIARRAGENRPEEIGGLFRQGVLISLIMAAIGIIVTWALTPWIFSLIIHDQQVQDKAVDYLRIRIWGPALFVYIPVAQCPAGGNQPGEIPGSGYTGRNHCQCIAGLPVDIRKIWRT